MTKLRINVKEMIPEPLPIDYSLLSAKETPNL